jgi:pimeloyl-ACP methyl ester carboxylesterase
MSAEFDHATAYTHADDVLSLLAHLDVQRVALVGLSFGGGVVLKTVGSRLVGGYPGHHWLGTDPHSSASHVRPIDALHTITVPTTVIVGERDVPCFIDMAEVLAREIPGAQLVRIPGAGHMTPMEAPDVFLRALHDARAR